MDEEKIKCGILTINVDLMNYGNRLQNYALQQTLIKLGASPYTVNYKPSYPEKSYINLNPITVEKTHEQKFRDEIKQIRCRLLFLRNRYARKKKAENYKNFLQSRIIWTSENYSINSDFSKLKAFDYMVAGSDQIWNPYWEGTQPIYFMEFMPEQKRIAYAASFGVFDIPEEMMDLYVRYLKAIPNISCREDRGCEIIEHLTGVRPLQVLDPVFLLCLAEWLTIEEKPKYFKKRKPYILVYILGDLSEEQSRKIKELKIRYGYDVIYLDQRDRFYSIFASPNEFLYLIHHAEVVCTDSFHGCAFSIVFNRPFVCFQRTLNNGVVQDMSSRLVSMFRLFQCDRYDSVLSISEMVNMEYKKINEIIRTEKEKSLLFLKNAIGK